MAARQARPQLFAGGYEPVETGPGVCAFRRGGGRAELLVLAELGRAGGSTLPDLGGGWVDLLTEAAVDDGRDVFAVLPVAVLLRG